MGALRQPLYQAALDLWTDARNDPDLRERLIEVERLLDRQTLELADRMFPARADVRELVQLSVATVRGLAMLDTLHPDGARNREQWAFIRMRLASLSRSYGFVVESVNVSGLRVRAGAQRLGGADRLLERGS